MSTENEDVVSSEELEGVTAAIFEQVTRFDPATGVEIMANVLIRLGFALDESLVSDSETGVLDAVATVKREGGETLATALVSQGLTMLTWVGTVEEQE